MQGILLFAALAIGLLRADSSASTYNVLYSFTGYPADGQLPQDNSLTLVNSTLYGLVFEGGANHIGVIFDYNLTSGAETVVYSFGNNLTDDGFPQGSFLQSGSILYSTASSGGTDGSGAIITFDTSDDTETVIHSLFGPTDGSSPTGNLIQSGSILYGSTIGQTVDSDGTVYAFDTGTNTDTVLHYFAGRPSDGAEPTGVVQLGSKLYGVTGGGGVNGGGTIFSINTADDSESILHSFNTPFSTVGDGSNPNGVPTLVGSKLYGQTAFGGTDDDGVIYSLDTNTGAYSILYDFFSQRLGGGSSSLLADGSVLYGNSGNAIFSFDINTDALTVLHTFSQAGDGSGPEGNLLLFGSILYGMTQNGGTDNRGVIFSIVIPEPATLSLMSFGGGCLLLRRRRPARSACC